MSLSRFPRLAFSVAALAAAALCPSRAPAQTNTFPASGNVGIGTTTPNSVLDLTNRGSGSQVLNVVGGGWTTSTANISTNYPLVSTSGTNYIRNIGFYSYSLPINSGIVDSGYRIGLDVENFTYDPNFLGTLAMQVAVWARVGSLANGPGTIQNSYGVYIDNIDGPATIQNKFGVYQANPTAKNFFAGNLGIGTTTPLRPLHLYSSNGYCEAMWEAGSVNSATIGHIWRWGTDPSGGFSATALNGSLTSGQTALSMTSSGNVGIGTTNPTQKLSVNGAIQAKEVIVQTGWSDYVFKADYRLAPLSEVEGAIKRDGHLPGVPSEAQVAEQGISLGEMQAKLLAKIEELTLHQIEQEKRSRAQAEKIESLEAEIRTIKSTK